MFVVAKWLVHRICDIMKSSLIVLEVDSDIVEICCMALIVADILIDE